MNLIWIESDGDTDDDYLKAVARARGMTSEEEITEFLAALPRIVNNVASMADYEKSGT